jgi:hypothetical protein
VAPAILAASDNIGPGGIAFLVVVLLIVASVAIFFAMSRSLKSLRRSVNSGTFGRPDGMPADEPQSADEPTAHGGSAQPVRPGKPLIPSPKRPDDADA